MASEGSLFTASDVNSVSAIVAEPVEYPVQLGIAYLLLAGYLVRTLFVTFHLPASVGVIFTGFAFSYFFQNDIFFARDRIQELAFFLVLFTAGLEIKVWDLRPYIFVMACVPASLEIVGIALYGVLALHFTAIEGLVLGAVLVAIGDGLVIPKMKEFGVRFTGHPMPRIMFLWAPLEASYALTLFGVLVGVSAPASNPSPNVGLLVVQNLLRIVATVCAGAVLGACSGWLIPQRTRLTFQRKQVFTGSPVEAFLMILSVALVAFGLGATESGQELIPMPFGQGSLFQPELLLIVTGSFFASVCDLDVLHEVESILGGVWIFGQLFLFSMLGSRTTPSILPEFFHVLPCMLVGLTFRFVGVSLAVVLTMKERQRSWREAAPDAVFCFVSTLPRATIQGALGSVPNTERFFQHYPHRHEARLFIFIAARLYIVSMSVAGMLLLQTLGPRMLQLTADAKPEPPPYREATANDDDHSSSEPLQAAEESLRTTDVSTALEVLASEYTLDPSMIQKVLLTMSPARFHRAVEEEDAEDAKMERMISDPELQFQRRTSATETTSGVRLPAAVRRQTRGRKGPIYYELALAQFEAAGSLMAS